MRTLIGDGFAGGKHWQSGLGVAKDEGGPPVEFTGANRYVQAMLSPTLKQGTGMAYVVRGERNARRDPH